MEAESLFVQVKINCKCQKFTLLLVNNLVGFCSFGKDWTSVEVF